jgi:hypothetical protein
MPNSQMNKQTSEMHQKEKASSIIDAVTSVEGMNKEPRQVVDKRKMQHCNHIIIVLAPLWCFGQVIHWTRTMRKDHCLPFCVGEDKRKRVCVRCFFVRGEGQQIVFRLSSISHRLV